MEAQLKKLYEEYGFPAATKLYQIAKGKGMDVKLKDIIAFEKILLPQQIHKTRREEEGHIASIAPNERFQIDLLDMQKLSRSNSGYKWIVTCVDVFTRFAWCRPIKSKRSTDVLPAIKSIFNITIQIIY